MNNRAPAKVQKRVAGSDARTASDHLQDKHIACPRPFWSRRTQNPIETEGTYPLPEAQ
jgi:MoxR-like ATPase